MHQNEEVAQFIYKTKYLQEGESFEEGMTRIAGALQDNEEHFREFRDILLDQRFLPAGRIQVAVGATRSTTPYNCLTGDTTVLTDEGVKRIDEVLGRIVEVLTPLGFKKTKFFETGEKRTFNITFKRGKHTYNVRASENHKWPTTTVGLYDYNSYPTTEKLKDKLIYGFMRGSLNTYSEDYRLGVIHGLVYGDGTASQDNGFHIRLCGDVPDLAPYFEGFPCSYPPSFEGNPVYYFYGKNVWTDLKALPPSFDVKNREYLLGFFRGWFAADGCVTEQPEVLLCLGEEEEEWVRKYGPLVGWFPMGSSLLADTTNYGPRNKYSRNLRFDRTWLEAEDFLIRRKAERFKKPVFYDNKFKAVNVVETDTVEKTYCCEVSGNVFYLGCGALSGNCYVSGTIEDSMESIHKRLGEALQTMRLGGGIGYSWGDLRPSGERIVSLSSSSCGPVGDAHRSRGFMDLFDAGCSVISSAGHRRGAQMAVLRVDHPDIRHFIRAKRQAGRLTNFNVSVGITDEFMQAVKEDREFDLRFCGKVYETIRARNLWDEIMRGTWDFAEPGVLFLDTINRKNNLWYCETIAATNPCGEQPLPPYGACLLGSFNLTKYITPHYYVDRITEEGGPVYQDGWDFDWDRFIEDIPVVVRSMDNVIDNAIYPLPEQEEEAKNKRRMGLGITGLANTAEVLGWPYGSKEMLAFTETVMKTLRDEAYMASVELAKEKGPFPLFDKYKYTTGECFVSDLPDEIIMEIWDHGIRNSHLLSIAPTGTISLAAGNISSGIEPPYTLGSYIRNVYNPDGSISKFNLMDFAEANYGVAGVTSQDCKLTDHVEVLNLCSAYVDSSVSKTCNVGPEITFNEFKEVYMQAYEGGASGITTFRPVEYGGKREGIFSSDKEEELVEGPMISATDIKEREKELFSKGSACYLDEMGNRSCDV